ncbi:MULTISPECIES: hypothetical protein [Myxococcus]|uniref:Uncharacterized protein n=1 Tax=Myxococcus llanfairpwllgwyngyllgogerychwyrndrobwllllantysiliogogogochensis TaxID=2590453 RepID=A0A540X6R2_9BACT|nr:MULTISPECIES: hypothetical protein [Myxococcus]NTX04613.1 hypothetical protein [Myxococcus sp. CA040A]TQF16880.1 hypothetical protein FJV41_06250 [Myxococcus llanfairpwllgwyngyllgogerychwyrndrobwllllantysiliogogogochensis]
MKPSSLRAALCVLSALASPVAFAWGSTYSIPLFESRMTAARASGSTGGTTVIRSEMKTALESFLSSDDGQTDAAEYTYLAGKVASPTFLTGIDTSARDYLFRYHELNDGAATTSPLDVASPAQTPAQIFGASGRLASNAWIQEGGMLGDEGVANQTTLMWTYYGYFGPQPSTFAPVTYAELSAKLGSTIFGQAPSAAEVNGALAWLSAHAGTGARYYVASWHDSYGRTGPGDIGGYVVASVNNTRDSVRYIEVMTWSD